MVGGFERLVILKRTLLITASIVLELLSFSIYCSEMPPSIKRSVITRVYSFLDIKITEVLNLSGLDFIMILNVWMHNAILPVTKSGSDSGTVFRASSSPISLFERLSLSKLQYNSIRLP